MSGAGLVRVFRNEIEEKVWAALQSCAAVQVSPTDADFLADRLVDLFDIQEKPVVTDEALGVMTRNAYRDETWLVSECGRQLRLELEAAGLRIVKVDAE